MPQNAQAIADIVQLAFHEQANPVHIQRLIASGEHQTWVAVADKVVGFVDGFLTIAQDGTKRLELDLLGVHPDFTAQGIGKQLINAFSENVGSADIIRALVAVNNKPMQHAMLATGYQLEPQEQALYLVSDNAEKTQRSPATHLILVETFTYSGIWLEGEITIESIKAAQYQGQKQGVGVVGVVIPTENSKTVQVLQSAGFEHVKDFQWWTKTPKLDVVPEPR
jgi:GNAT superfamily N-acetyltransferase